ncbi:MAG: hypothetical protein LC777_22235, partial [Actinobacteria bacterium]|nr:hypothetical protein [Actinomycetota bacterium]
FYHWSGRQIVVRDLALDSTGERDEPVSVSSSGEQSNATPDAFHISPDGRYVTFDSEATNLVAGDTNRMKDVFVRDLEAKTTTRASLSYKGEQGNDLSELDTVPPISAYGRDVVFRTNALNLIAQSTIDDGLRQDPVVMRSAMRATELAFTASSAASVQHSDSATLRARFSAGGAPAAGVPLSFELTGPGAKRTISTTTDAQGLATETVAFSERPGAYDQLSVRFGGAPDAYQAATATTAFAVTKEDSAATLKVTGKAGKRVLAARLFDEDSPASGVGGRTLLFYANGVLVGTAITASDGSAQLKVPAKYQKGGVSFRVAFAGDDYYKPTEATASS